MVGFDVRRGEVRKAIDTVLALPYEADHWRSAYIELVAALYLTGHDAIAAELLACSLSDHPGVRLAGSVAERLAAERPDLAIQLADGNRATLAAMAPALAPHDDFAELAVRSVQGEPELQLAVARALAPASRRPRYGPSQASAVTGNGRLDPSSGAAVLSPKWKSRGR